MAAAAVLDLHEGIDTPPRIPDPRTGCGRWPEHLRLLNETTGELVLGRCRATNLCAYCQALYVLETVEMLTLDAMEHAPTLWAVLTSREHLTRAQCRRHLDKIRQGLKRRWPSIEWFVQVEFQRRGALHLNLLIKGVDVGDQEQLLEHLAERWCARVDAEPVGQWMGQISEAGGVVRYLQKTLSHGLKREQAPPIGWRGHRTSQTRGYLVRPASSMREEARRSLRLKRELWRAINGGQEGEQAEVTAHAAVAAAAQASWRLYGINLKRGQSNPAQRHLTAAEGPPGAPQGEPVGQVGTKPPPGRPESGRATSRAPGEVARSGAVLTASCPPANPAPGHASRRCRPGGCEAAPDGPP